MPHAFFNFNFDTDLDGFVWSTDQGSGLSWDGADGDPAPGCAQTVTLAFEDTLNVNIRWAFGQGYSWETLGVPSGATVTNVQGAVNVKWTATSGVPVSNSFILKFVPDFGGSPIATMVSVGALANGWQPFSGANQNITPPELSSTNICLSATFNITQGAGDRAQLKIDSIALDITYAVLPPPCDLTVTPVPPATVYPHQTIQFTATGTSTPVNWSVVGGTANGTIDSSGLYTAPAAPGTYTVQATSQADPTCVAGAQAVVIPFPGTMPRMGIRGIKSVTPYPRDRARATYMGHGYWGRIVTPIPVPVCALWRAYTKGFVSGEDMTLAAFGLPTEFLVCGPLAANIVYTVQKPMVDPNGAVAGVPLIFKMERDATDADNTDTNPQSLIAIELIYDKA